MGSEGGWLCDFQRELACSVWTSEEEKEEECFRVHVRRRGSCNILRGSWGAL